MPRILVYEHLTALGIGVDPASPDHGMYREGRAMRETVADDFRRLPGWIVADAAAGSDWALVIAPETDRVLEQTVAGVVEAGGRSLNSSLPAIRLMSDKLALADLWVRSGVPTPHTLPAEQWMPDNVPAVVKPRDGAGSTATLLIRDDFRTQRSVLSAQYTGSLIAQPFVPGQPASIAFLIGPRHTIPLVPAFQRLSGDGRFHYLGGELPIPPALAERAVRLGTKAVACVPGLLGYVGIDLILGDAADGSQDYAIEINPRLTTSYVGLRALADFNIAEAMLAVADGRDPPPVRWKLGVVRFDPSGDVARA